MKKPIALIVAGVAVFLGFIFLTTIFGFRTDCVQAEAGIVAQYKANESTYDNMWKSFREMTQVSTMYTDQVKDVFKQTISGRYGEGGSKAIFQMLKEDNPKIDPALFTKIQTAIEAGRARFNQDQTELVDKKRQYDVILKGNSALVANVFFGFPHIDLSKYDIVTSDQTDKAFTSKKADEIKLN
jgi:hypothetical protein